MWKILLHERMGQRGRCATKIYAVYAEESLTRRYWSVLSKLNETM